MDLGEEGDRCGERLRGWDGREGGETEERMLYMKESFFKKRIAPFILWLVLPLLHLIIQKFGCISSIFQELLKKKRSHGICDIEMSGEEKYRQYINVKSTNPRIS